MQQLNTAPFREEVDLSSVKTPALDHGLFGKLNALDDAISSRDTAKLQREQGIRALRNSLGGLAEVEQGRISELRRYNQYKDEGLPTIDLAVSDEVIVGRKGDKVVTQQAVVDTTENGGFEAIVTRQQVRAVHNLADGGTAYGEPEEPTSVAGISEKLATKLYDNGMREHHARKSIDNLCVTAEGHIEQKIANVQAQQRRAEKGSKVETI